MSNSAVFHAPRVDPMIFVPNADLYEIRDAPYLWNINGITFQVDKTFIAGWCLPHDGLLDNTQIIINGHIFEPIRTSPEGIYAQLYPWHPNAAFSGFTLDIAHSIFDLRKEKELSISCQPKTGRSKKSTYTLDMLVADMSYNLPPADVSARIGVSEPLQYLMYGRAIYRGFERALKKNFATSFGDYGTVLDWGCGSARVARHVVPVLGSTNLLVGLDIDSYAVNWANENVGQHFRVCNTEPPLDLGSGSVDLAYAYSVFTHLAKSNMEAWIQELARVIKPGGIGLFTVLSESAMVALHPGSTRESLRNWNSVGIYDSAENTQLDTIGVSGDYYRNVWCKKGFLDTVFGRAFEIVDYIPTFHFYQDLIVVRRR